MMSLPRLFRDLLKLATIGLLLPLILLWTLRLWRLLSQRLSKAATFLTSMTVLSSFVGALW